MTDNVIKFKKRRYKKKTSPEYKEWVKQVEEYSKIRHNLPPFIQDLWDQLWCVDSSVFLDVDTNSVLNKKNLRPGWEKNFVQTYDL